MESRLDAPLCPQPVWTSTLAATSIQPSTNSIRMGAGNGYRQRASVDARAPDVKDLARSVTIAPQFLEYVRAAVSPGTTLIVTDLRVGGQTRSGPDVNILTTD